MVLLTVLTTVAVGVLVADLVVRRGAQVVAWTKGAEATVVADAKSAEAAVAADVKKL